MTPDSERNGVLQNELMFRATPGVGLSVKDTWQGNILPPTAQDTCISMETTSCSSHYRNPRVDLWESLSIFQVTIELYKHGSKVAFITFDGKNSNINDWFSSSRILNSSWSDVTPSTIYNYFSIEGYQARERKIPSDAADDLGTAEVMAVFVNYN
uniref:Uncharacterized protein n=1 Tax=Magallana gigas TaxID=29159 RepID=K1QST1_MAGGI